MYKYQDYWHLTHRAILPSIGKDQMGKVVGLPGGGQHDGGEDLAQS